MKYELVQIQMQMQTNTNEYEYKNKYEEKWMQVQMSTNTDEYKYKWIQVQINTNTNEYNYQCEWLRIQLQRRIQLQIQVSLQTVGIFSFSVSHCDFVKIMQTEFKWDLITNKQKSKNARNDWRSAFVQLTDYTNSLIHSLRFRFDWTRQIEELQIENENEFVRKVFRECFIVLFLGTDILHMLWLIFIVR